MKKIYVITGIILMCIAIFFAVYKINNDNDVNNNGYYPKWLIERALRIDKELAESFSIYITNENNILNQLGLTDTNVDEYAIALSDDGYIIAVIKPSKNNNEVVLNKLHEYRDKKLENIEKYSNSQIEIINNSQILEVEEEVGIYYILVISEHQSDIVKYINFDIKNTRITTGLGEGID